MIEAGTNGGTLRLLIVHGMSNHTQGYSSNFVNTIARKLRLGWTSNRVEVLTDAAGFTNGFLVSNDFANKTNRLRSYELTWTPTTQRLKEEAFQYDSRLNKKRASLNRSIKSMLFNDAFADAVLYLSGGYKPKIQEPVTNTLFKILSDGFSSKDEFVIITHSLGSKLTFDSLNVLAERLSRTDPKQAQILTNLAVQTAYLIMLANQIPLLRLGETNLVVDSAPPAKAKAIQQFLDMRQEGLDRKAPSSISRTNAILRIIAVSDPNDLLSYSIEKTNLVSASSANVDFGNVLMCNTPVLLGWIAHPLDAHQDYFQNPKLIKLLLNGYHKKERRCIPEPKRKSL